MGGISISYVSTYKQIHIRPWCWPEALSIRLWGLLLKTTSVTFTNLHRCPGKALFLLDMQTWQHPPPELISVETQWLLPQGNVIHSVIAYIRCFHAPKLSLEDSQKDVGLLVCLGLSQCYWVSPSWAHIETARTTCSAWSWEKCEMLPLSWGVDRGDSQYKGSSSLQCGFKSWLWHY